MRKRTLRAIVLAVLFFGSYSLAEAEEKKSSLLSIQEGVMCLDVVDRVPVGTGDIFPKEVPKLFCFTKVLGAQTPTTITHIWYHNGALESKVTLPVNSVSWRTWSSLMMTPEKAGEWMVEIVTEDGIALESIIFLIR